MDGVDYFSAGGLGSLSLNGNALINPQGWSKFLKDLPLAREGQHEGFMYLGLGTILLVVVNLSLLVFKNNIEFNKKSAISVGTISFLLFLFSLSNVITFNDKILLTIHLPDSIGKILSIFRSTGRFMWPVFYLITFAVIINLLKNKVSNFKLAIFFLCIFIIQYTDLYPNFKERNMAFGKEIHYESPLKSTFWGDMANIIDNIIFIPPSTKDYDHFSWYAVNHNLTLNTGYFARGPYQQIDRYASGKLEQLMAGNPDPRDLYILKAATEELLAKCNDAITCVFVDGYIVAYSKQLNVKNIGYNDALKITGNPTPFVDYLTHLIEDYGNKDYLILASVKDEASGKLNEELVDKMRQIGMSGDLMGKFRWSYVWAKSTKNDEVVAEKLQKAMIEEVLTAGRSFADQPLRGDIIIKSAGLESGNFSQIIINGINYSLAFRGMNFVIYDVINDQVVELAAFDLYAKTSGVMLKLSKMEG